MNNETCPREARWEQSSPKEKAVLLLKHAIYGRGLGYLLCEEAGCNKKKSLLSRAACLGGCDRAAETPEIEIPEHLA